MATIAEVEKLASELSESQRATLAARLLQTLPPVLWDDDEGIAEAIRRDSELSENPEIGISIEELDREIQARHG